MSVVGPVFRDPWLANSKIVIDDASAKDGMMVFPRAAFEATVRRPT